MLMTRFNEAQMNGNYVSNNIPTTSQRIGRPLRRPQLPQKPQLTPGCKLKTYKMRKESVVQERNLQRQLEGRLCDQILRI